MKYAALFIRVMRDFFAKYPAVLSGYIIYSYLFVSIMRLFFKVKHGGAVGSDAYDIFSALPFMWLLAVALVKVIDYRTRLHEAETLRIRDQQQLKTKETQLATMKEVVRTLQHEVNNPLAIISLSLARLKRGLSNSPDLITRATDIETASNRIGSVIADLLATNEYATEQMEPIIGAIAALPKKP